LIEEWISGSLVVMRQPENLFGAGARVEWGSLKT
jgi:hypothetical protein